MKLTDLKPSDALKGKRGEVLAELERMIEPDSLRWLKEPAAWAQALLDQGVIDILAPGGNIAILADMMAGGQRTHLSKIRSGAHPSINLSTFERLGRGYLRMARAAERNELPEAMPGRPVVYGRWTGELAPRKRLTKPAAETETV